MTPLAIFSVNIMSEHLLLLASILVFVAIPVVKLGSKLGAPSLLLFLILGLIAGPDVIGITFGDVRLAESVGHFAMSVILLTAGLETSLEETKPIMKKGIVLSTVGVLLTVLITGSALTLFGMPLLTCFLLAAILSSTDSASVFSVLSDKKLRLRENLGPLLELESGSNDPVAFTLTAILVQFASVGAGVATFFLELGIGLAVGLAVGYAAKWVLDRVEIGNFALTSILILSIAFFSNGFAQALSGNGLLATYVTAIFIGNKVKQVKQKDIYKFFDGITWLMQLAMFLILGLLAHPSQMLHLILPALGLCLFMAFVARPAGVFLSLLPFKGLSVRAKALVSWVGLKGAGPILFALYTLVHRADYSMDIFNFVFLFALFSLLLQGTSFSWMAKKLHLSYDEDPEIETFGMEIPDEMGIMRDHVVTSDDLEGGATLRDLHLPHGIRVMMVRRGERFLVPHGSMPLEVGDHLVIIVGETDD